MLSNIEHFVQVTHWLATSFTALHDRAVEFRVEGKWAVHFEIEIDLPDSEPARDARPTIWPILGNSLGPHSPTIPWVSDDQSTSVKMVEEPEWN